jgi:predicted transposase YbfD/YdcC
MTVFGLEVKEVPKGKGTTYTLRLKVAVVAEIERLGRKRRIEHHSLSTFEEVDETSENSRNRRGNALDNVKLMARCPNCS